MTYGGPLTDWPVTLVLFQAPEFRYDTTKWDIVLFVNLKRRIFLMIWIDFEPYGKFSKVEYLDTFMCSLYVPTMPGKGLTGYSSRVGEPLGASLPVPRDRHELIVIIYQSILFWGFITIIAFLRKTCYVGTIKTTWPNSQSS